MLVLGIVVFRHLTINYGLELTNEMICDADEADKVLCWILV